MSVSHTLRKIARPALPPHVLHRESLVRRLNEVLVGPSTDSTTTTDASEYSSYKLVLLHAPAGYGKTTLLADFARQTTLPCCWYILDRSDTDKITFLERLLASIRSRFPQFGAALDSLLAGAITQDSNLSIEHRLTTVVEALVEALETEISERFALILCNYHEVNAYPEINSLLNTLLQHPLRCVLVIESRALPDLDFATLLARREVFGLSSDLFHLNTQEIHDLADLQGAGSLSEAEAESLVTSFDGWMAGILLGTRLGDVRFLQRQSGPLQESSGKSLERQLLFAYVVNEVFKHYPEAYAFLKEACILQEMLPAICDALLERTDSFQQLHKLEQQGLFVSHSGADAQITYTCHPVLRDVLIDELRRYDPEQFALLHRRAAELLGAAQDYEHAIDYAFTAGANDLAAQFILAVQEQMVLQGQVELLTRWIDALPASILTHSSKLLLLRARLHCLAEEYTRALPLLAAAEEAITGQPSESETNDLPTLQAEIALLRAGVLFRRGVYHEAGELCQQVLASLSADEVNLRTAAHIRLGGCASLMGDYADGLVHLQKALQFRDRHTSGQQVADIHCTLANIYSLLGNFALCDHHMIRAIKCREETYDVWGKTYDLIRLGVQRQRQGMFVEAETAFTQALTLANTIHYLSGQAYALENLGELYLEQGHYERSLAVTEEGLAAARQLEDIYLSNWCLYNLALTYLYMGDAATATLLVADINVRSARGETIGHEQALRDLATGIILLHQQRYGEACTHLSKLEAVLNTSGLRREQFQTTLCLAACYLAQGQHGEVVRCLDAIAALLANYSDYERLVHNELRRLPNLEQVVRTLPEAARLRIFLHLEPETHEMEASAEPKSRPPAPGTPPIPTTSSPQLRIVAFGEPAVFLAEQPITHWRMVRAMELFFFLLDAGRPLRKEQILTALWSEVDERSDQTLHSTVYYLRKAVGESCLVSRGGTYALDLPSRYGNNIRYDVTQFRQAYDEAKQALARTDDEATVQQNFETMVSLYQGDYVQSFYSDWCISRRDELRRSYLDARHHLAGIVWRHGDYEQSDSHWQHMLALDSCLEEAHYGLMRSYLQRGKRGLALRQYQRCRDTLQQELGVQPGPNIQHLYQRLIASS